MINWWGQNLYTVSYILLRSLSKNKSLWLINAPSQTVLNLIFCFVFIFFPTTLRKRETLFCSCFSLSWVTASLSLFSRCLALYQAKAPWPNHGWTQSLTNQNPRLNYSWPTNTHHQTHVNPSEFLFSILVFLEYSCRCWLSLCCFWLCTHFNSSIDAAALFFLLGFVGFWFYWFEAFASDLNLLSAKIEFLG